MRVTFDRVVVLASGDDRATKKLVRRVRKLGGDDLHVAVTGPVEGIVGPTLATTVHSGVDSALGDGDGDVLVVRDDARLGRSVLDALEAGAAEHGTVTVWTSAPGSSNHADLPPRYEPGPVPGLPGPTRVDGAVAPVAVAGPPAALAGVSWHRFDHPAVVLPVAAPSSGRSAPLLVANLIVRDEIDRLEDCLASLDRVVDRVEVCDTGSVDGTADLARRIGAVVSEAPWEDDFSAARTRVLEGSRDAVWILWIDADERFECSDPDAFREWLRAVPDDVDALVVPIENRDPDGTATSEFDAIRVFRGSGTTFAGRVHERVVRSDGGEVAADRADGVRITHHGYDDETVGARAKRSRNLAIARSAHADDPTPRTAFELARAVRLADGDPEEAVELLTEALDGAGDLRAAGRSHILASRAHARLALEDSGGAWEDAVAALDLVPAEDLAAAVAANAAHQMGVHDQLIGLAADLDRRRGPDPILASPANRARFASLVAASLVALGRIDEAVDHAASAVSRAGTFTAWRELVSAATAVDDPAALLRRFAPWDPDGAIAEAAASVFPPERTAELAADLLDEGSGTGTTVAIGLTAAAIAGNTSLVDRFESHAWTLDRETTSRLVEVLAGRGLDDAAPWLVEAQRRPVGDLAVFGLEDLGDLGTATTPAQVAVADGPPVEALRSVLGERVLDLAGLGLGTGDGTQAEWVVLPPGAADTSSVGPGAAAVTWGDEEAERLRRAGWSVESVSPVVIARPPWDEAVVADAVGRIVDPPEADVVVVPVGGPAPGPEFAVAVAASLPGRAVGVAVDASAGLASRLAGVDDATPVLVIPATVVPDPAWILPLVSAGAPAGAGLVSASGVRVHAAADVKGRPFGAGALDTGHPVLAAARPARLLPPFVAAARDLRVDPYPIGTYLGTVTAVDRSDPTLPVDEAGIRDVFGSSVLVLVDDEEGAGADAARQVVDAAVAEGRTPVVFRLTGRPAEWQVRRGLADGVVHLWRPGAEPTSVAAAFQPDLVAVLGPRALDAVASGVLSVAPSARSIYHGPVPDDHRHLERVDEVVDGDPGHAARRLLGRPRPPVVPEPRDIGVVAHRSGVVSVVIPVWNRADLTERCLDSLAAHAEAPLEIVVVDNGSTDTTPDLLATRDVTVVRNEENLGFARAVNQGIAAAGGEYVCVLNNDTEVTAGWLGEMLAVLQESGTGLVGPRSNEISGHQHVPDAPGMDDADAAHRWAVDWAEARRGGSWLTARLVGFCLLGRRSLFEAVGGFDESFGIGNFEDDELCARVRRAGLDLRVADGAVVLHHGGATFDALGVDYASVIARAARGFGTRPGSGLLAAVVLAGAEPAPAVRSAFSALAIADRVRIVARGGLGLHQLAGDVLGRTGVEIVRADWTTPEGAMAAVEGIDDGQLLVVAAGERVHVEDVGRVRARIERLPAAPVAVAVDGVEEVRVHPPGPGAVAAVGSAGEHRLAGVRLSR